MNDKRKTKAQLIEEISDLRLIVSKLAASKGDAAFTVADHGESAIETAAADKSDIRTTVQWWESESRHRALVEQSVDAIYILQDGRYELVNPAWEHLLGYSREEALNPRFDFMQIVADESRALIKGRRRAVETGLPVPLRYEFKAVTAGGKILDLEVSTSYITWHGRPATQGLYHDITQRKRAKQAVLQSEQRFRDLFEGSPDAIFVHARDGSLMDVNPAACHLHGMTRDELMEKNVANLVPLELADSALEYLGELFEEGSGYSEGKSLRVDGGHVPIELRARRIEYNNTPAILMHAHDITNRKRLEEQLSHSQKMEAVGRLAGGVAHDFNNLMTVIVGHAEFGLQQTTECNQCHNEFRQIDQAAQQAGDLVAQLLSFSRRQVLDLKVIDLNETVRRLADLLERVLGPNIRLSKLLDSEISAVYADSNQIQQVLMNVALNARDAMPTGGELTFRTRSFEADDEFLGLAYLDASPGTATNSRQFVEIMVSDTGEGMDAETLSRIFDPFFTTKPLGKGTGLGLAVMYGIVKQHGGAVKVESEVGRGSTFRIYFPAAGVSSTSGAGDAKPSTLPRGGETILVVEDQEIVRKVSVRILEGLGYRVLQAESGHQAIEVFLREKDGIDLAVMDVIMPGMDGLETYRELSATKPRLPVIFVTGFAVESRLAELDHIMESEPCAVLPKPFNKRDLAMKVRQILDSA